MVKEGGLMLGVTVKGQIPRVICVVRLIKERHLTRKGDRRSRGRTSSPSVNQSLGALARGTTTARAGEAMRVRVANFERENIVGIER